MFSQCVRLALLAAVLGVFPSAEALTLNVATTGGNDTSPLMYGILYEDVYHSGDGGIYSEMIQNRAFQGTSVNTDGNGHVVPPFQTLQYWHTRGSDVLTLDNEAPLLTSALPWQMRVDVAAGATGATGFWNEGYWGFNITTATRYAASFHLRGNYNGQILCAFWSNTTNSMLGSTTFTVSQTESQGWVAYAQTFTTTDSAPDEKNSFHLTFDGAQVAGNSLRFQMISVFQQTWENGNNGLRMDIAEAVNDIGGKFFRMPGGNNLEGQSAGYRWKWNETIGPIINRPGRPGTWGYVNTDGLGLLELMQWGIDMGLETILAVWAGYYLDGEVVSQANLQPYIDDAMNRVGVLAGYRFMMFYDAIKAVYPNMNIVSSVWSGYFNPPLPKGVVQDLHDYLSASEMVGKFGGYDHASRDYPVLVGEYAAIYDDNNPGPNQLDNPTLQSATSEAVYFLGLERNGDLVIGSSHGALIKSFHDEPDNVAMIKHTANTIVPSMSYYVAKLFANNYGPHAVPVTADSGYGPLYWSTTKNAAGTYFVKIVNYNGAVSTPVTVVIPGKTNAAKLTTLTAPNAESINALGSITSVWTETTVASNGGSYTFTLTGNYVNAVLVI